MRRIIVAATASMALSCAGERGADPGGTGSSTSFLDHAVLDRSDLVENPDGSLSCVPRDAADDDWYGCYGETDEDDLAPPCIATPSRIRILAGGGVVLQMHPQCAAGRVWDVRVDGVEVPTNLIVWGAELEIPPGAAGTMDAASTGGLAATWRFRDDLRLEEDECGHEPLVKYNGEGDRRALCREEWREFTAAGGETAGFLAGNVAVAALGTGDGDTVSIDVGFAGCDIGETSSIGNDLEALAAECCVPAWPQHLEWTVGEWTQLEGSNYFVDTYGWSDELCCSPADADVTECPDYTVARWEAGRKEI